jgi:hypothetical protein
MPDEYNGRHIEEAYKKKKHVNKAVVRERLGGSNPTQRDKGGAWKRTLSTWRQTSRMCKGSDGNVWNADAVRRLATKSGHQDHSTQE